MSRNVMSSERKLDRRVRRTRKRLGDALVELLHEKPFDAITVQEVLDRAGVARSTFYSHFRDKEDLLVSDVDEFWTHVTELLPGPDGLSRRVVPVRELFSHIADMQPFWAALVASGRLDDVLDLGEAHLARLIERRLAEDPGVRGSFRKHRAATARTLAGALLALASWWIERAAPEPPALMDDLFHALVWTGVGAPSPPRR